MGGLSVFDIIELINVIPEILIIALFYHRIFKRKFSSALPYVLCYAVAFIALSLVSILIGEPRVQISVTFIILIVTGLFFYSGSIVAKIFASIYYVVMVLVAETLFVGILMLMGYGNPTELLASGVGRVIGMIGTKIFDFWIIVYSCRIYKSKVKSLPLKYWILILMMPFLSAIMLDLIFPKIGDDMTVMVFFVVTICGLLYLNISVFNYFESYDNQVRVAALEQILERENENYRTLESSYAEVRSIKHDLRNQVSLLNNLIKSNDYATAQEHMCRLYDTVESATSVCYTGNAAIDSIINMKGTYAKCNGISFVTKVQVNNILFDTVGVCRILGNALDNAIEACERLSSGGKSVFLMMSQFENKLIIELNNTSPQVDTDNLITSKQNKAIHGIGLKSIRQTVEKLNGHLNYSYSDGYFTLKIVLVK